LDVVERETEATHDRLHGVHDGGHIGHAHLLFEPAHWHFKATHRLRPRKNVGLRPRSPGTGGSSSDNRTPPVYAENTVTFGVAAEFRPCPRRSPGAAKGSKRAGRRDAAAHRRPSPA